MGTSSHSNRSQFLIDRYCHLWSNVDRSMKGIWSILGTITIIGIILTAIYKDHLSLNIGAVLLFIILFWALNMTIDLNAWHTRNLFFIAAIEREFLSQDDYGKLLPVSYRTPKHKWITFYFINIITFILLLFSISFYIFRFQINSCYMKDWYVHLIEWHWLVLILGILITI